MVYKEQKGSDPMTTTYLKIRNHLEKIVGLCWDERYENDEDNYAQRFTINQMDRKFEIKIDRSFLKISDISDNIERYNELYKLQHTSLHVNAIDGVVKSVFKKYFHIQQPELSDILAINKDMEIGQWYWVPCFIIKTTNRQKYCSKKTLVPVYDHCHNDLENGQTIPHYHLDFRFRFSNHSFNYFELRKHNYDLHPKFKNESQLIENDKVIGERHGPRFMVYDEKEVKKKLLYVPGKFVTDGRFYVTPAKMIEKSKLKNCIKNGKCPHRGHDLRNEKPDQNGIVTCPLHQLKFKDNVLIPLSDPAYLKP